MQTLNIHRSEMPDLQFVLVVTALCTSRLTDLNISETLRATIFNRCWALIHESPPPRRPEDRILDLRPWTEITVEAMAEIIRRALTEAGISILAWDTVPSKRTPLSSIEAQPVLERLEQLHASVFETSDTDHREVVLCAPNRRDNSKPDIWQLIDEIGTSMAAVTSALVCRATDLTVSGKDPETVGKLLKGAELIRDSGSIFLRWARRYGALADDDGKRIEETDGSGTTPG